MDRLSETFAALADPTRRAILARLTLGETSVAELSKPFDISGPAISKHLRVLRAARLVAERKDGRRRMLTLSAEPLRQIDAWMEQYRHEWRERLQNLKQHVERRQRRSSS